jgi:hypothetical protein
LQQTDCVCDYQQCVCIESYTLLVTGQTGTQNITEFFSKSISTYGSSMLSFQLRTEKCFNCKDYKSIGTAFKTPLFGFLSFSPIEAEIPYKYLQELPSAKSAAAGQFAHSLWGSTVLIISLCCWMMVSVIF